MTTTTITAIQTEDIASTVERHEAAAKAWVKATTATDVVAARDLSRLAAASAVMDAAWLDELHAACIDAEAEHAADLHAQAIASLGARHPSAPRRAAG